MNIHFIKSNQKRDIIEKLKTQFGISELPYLLIESGKEKVRAFSGHLSKEEISKITQIANVEIVGFYLLRQESQDDIRLSFDAPIILKDQITNNIIEINKEQFDSWIRGENIEISTPRGNVIIKYQDDFLGCGKSNGLKVFNYVPKDRRLRK